MSIPLRGRYRARYSETAEDLRAAQALRWRSFRGATTGPGLDRDGFDARARHVLVEDVLSGRLVCCYRLMTFADGGEIAGSYSAQFYELSALARFPGPMLEVGRFCIEAGAGDADVLRVAWAALAEHVARNGIELVFGCSSFRGVETEAYADAFALLGERHLAPRRWLPRVKAPAVFRFARQLRLRRPDLEGGNEGDAAAPAQLSRDGRLGVGPCGGGPRPRHAARLHRARDPRGAAGAGALPARGAGVTVA